GAELEAAIVLAPGLVFAQAAGYTHATNTTTVVGAGVKDGDRLLDVPQFTANTSLTYRYPLQDALTLVARINNNYVDSIQDITAQRNTLPPYDLVNTRLGVESDHWSAALFVNNLANKTALLSDTGALSANINILNRVAVAQPRTIGADLTYRY
ncbi:MAG: TonB-dependent receptor, partial [Chloroflexi bacterium]|nr:TonB-dependent receptor [Chloroflexota bacterium]